LYDDAKRREYIQKLAAAEESKGPASSAGDAASAFRQAEQLFKKKEFVAAEQQYDAAFALERKAIYLAGKAWCLYMDSARRGDGSKAKQVLNEAIRMDRQCAPALYQLGVIARVEGDMERAERCFRDAVGANPKHVEARQELRLIEMRRKKSK
jgi:tetratricopeptide (TPR) repeat protein